MARPIGPCLSVFKIMTADHQLLLQRYSRIRKGVVMQRCGFGKRHMPRFSAYFLKFIFFRGDPGLGFPLGSETVVDCSHIAELGPRNPALLTSSLTWACQLGHGPALQLTLRTRAENVHESAKQRDSIGNKDRATDTATCLGTLLHTRGAGYINYSPLLG